MTTRHFYALKVIGTEEYISYRRGQRMGFTSNEPNSHDAPRLHTTKAAATQALKWWKAGKYIAHYNDSFNDFTYKNVPVPARAEIPLEVVKIRLVEVA